MRKGTNVVIIEEVVEGAVAETKTEKVEKPVKKRSTKPKAQKAKETEPPKEEPKERDQVQTRDGEYVYVDGLATISKAIKESLVKVNGGNELRFLIDSYYQTQTFRIAIASQVRAVEQGYDGDGTDNALSIRWVLSNVHNQELQIKKMLDVYTDNDPVSSWAKATVGIGPVIAAALVSYFDISRCSHYNQFHTYAGLNDNNIPWLGVEKAKKVVKDVWEELEKKTSDKKVDEEVIAAIAEKTNRTVESIIRGLNGESTRSKLESYLAKPPYNTELKKLCWKIGESFVKVSKKPNSLYGRLYRQRKAYEIQMNNKKEYESQAKHILETKNIGKDTDAYAAYSQGMLPPAHINERAKRYAVKMFISHLFEAMYRDYHRKNSAPKPYPLAYLDHEDYIAPEVPIENYIHV